jgi:hypothetical protein
MSNIFYTDRPISIKVYFKVHFKVDFDVSMGSRFSPFQDYFKALSK